MIYDDFGIGIAIDGRPITSMEPPYIVAELSGNHKGDIERAKDMIKLAQLAGADAVKLQTYDADDLTIDCDGPDFIVKEGLWEGRKLYDLYKEAHTPYEWHGELFEFARKVGITIFSTPFSERAVKFLEGLNCPAYKIASFENNYLQLIHAAAETGKPIIISTGMATDNEIYTAVNEALNAGDSDVILLKCVSAYPAPAISYNLHEMEFLYDVHACPVGISDHTLGTAVPVAATALGAVMIEKHFTLDRNDGAVDSRFSLTFEELKKLVEDTEEAWEATRDNKSYQRDLEKDSLAFRRSLYVVEDMKAGDRLTSTNMRIIRPGYGISPSRYSYMLGKEIKEDTKRGTPLQENMVNHE